MPHLKQASSTNQPLDVNILVAADLDDPKVEEDLEKLGINYSVVEEEIFLGRDLILGDFIIKLSENLLRPMKIKTVTFRLNGKERKIVQIIGDARDVILSESSFDIIHVSYPEGASERILSEDGTVFKPGIYNDFDFDYIRFIPVGGCRKGRIYLKPALRFSW